MNKYILLIILALGLTSCTKKDEHYYREHPALLAAAVKACPAKQPEGLSCKEIAIVNNQMTSLAYQLQYSPQGFGNKILSLQQKIAKEKLDLQKDASNTELKKSLQEDEHELDVLLSVVKWLESPES